MEWVYHSVSANGNLHTVCEWLNEHPSWEFVAYDGGGYSFTLIYRVRK